MNKYKRTEWTGYYDNNLEKICAGDLVVSLFDGGKYILVPDKEYEGQWVFKNIDTGKEWCEGTADTSYVIICRECTEEE